MVKAVEQDGRRAGEAAPQRLVLGGDDVPDDVAGTIYDVVASGPITLSPRPRAELLMENGPFWWVTNPAGLQRLVEAAGFEGVTRSRPYILPWGPTGQRLTWRRTLRRPVTDIPRRLIHPA